MSTEITAVPDVNLDQRLSRICALLGIYRAPTIAWDPAPKPTFDGLYNYKQHAILISPKVRVEVVDEIIVHELCHAVLCECGYTSAGHSRIFLAAFELFMRRCQFAESIVEGCAVANWNRWATWPVWYRHVVSAQEIVAVLTQEPTRLQGGNATGIARAVINAAHVPKYLAWLAYRWHEIVGDTRGNWFAVWLGSKALIFASFALMVAPYPPVQRFGVGAFVCGYIGMSLVSKIFRLNENRCFAMPLPD